METALAVCFRLSEICSIAVSLQCYNAGLVSGSIVKLLQGIATGPEIQETFHLDGGSLGAPARLRLFFVTWLDGGWLGQWHGGHSIKA
jgi:hypothetical protein